MGPGRRTLWQVRRYTMNKSLHGTPKPGLDGLGLEKPVTFSPQSGHYTDCALQGPGWFGRIILLKCARYVTWPGTKEVRSSRSTLL